MTVLDCFVFISNIRKFMYIIQLQKILNEQNFLISRKKLFILIKIIV